MRRSRPADGAAADGFRRRPLHERPRTGFRRVALAGSLGLVLAPVGVCPASAGAPGAGRDKAVQCRTCHGIDGIGRMPNVPNLAGQSEMYLEKQLRAFRSGERQAPQMSVIAAGLSDADIVNLAAWYASIEVTVKMPE